ncbi:MAG: YjzC family protein [Phycisphaerae bacterium]|nr:YjzC family protein [Phycisphaerae bacterium]
MQTSTQTRTRFKTGETCVISGRYRFDGYVDGTATPRPTHEEMGIPLTRGETFPPIRSSGKACWWKLAQRT